MIINWYIIDFHSHHEIEEFLKHLDFFFSKKDDTTIHICIYNVWDDKKISIDHPKIYKNIKVKNFSGPNLGYFGSFFYMKSLEETSDHASISVFSNTDIELEKFDIFRILNENSSEFLLAPNILNSSGLDLNPHFKISPSKAKLIFYAYVFSLQITAIMYRFLAFCYRTFAPYIKDFLIPSIRKKGLKVPLQSSKKIYGLQGSFILFKGDDKKLLKLLAYPLFLFNDELFLAKTANDLGIPTLHSDAVIVRHEGGMTTGKVLFRSKDIFQWFKDATSNGPNISK